MIRVLLLTDDRTYRDDLLTLEDAAKYLRLSRSRISQLVQDGTLAKHPLNDRCMLVAKADLDGYKASGRAIG